MVLEICSDKGREREREGERERLCVYRVACSVQREQEYLVYNNTIAGRSVGRCCYTYHVRVG